MNMLSPRGPHIPKDIGELRDLLNSMMISSPTFKDNTGYFPEDDIDTTFHALKEGLKNTRKTLGDERYRKLVEMSDQMRAYFEADPEDKTDDTIKGRELILDMIDLLKVRRLKARD
jgi:hypothetical protein